jgi:hypothetical protein
LPFTDSRAAFASVSFVSRVCAFVAALSASWHFAW